MSIDGVMIAIPIFALVGALGAIGMLACCLAIMGVLSLVDKVSARIGRLLNA
jgi:hypothetical protein